MSEPVIISDLERIKRLKAERDELRAEIARLRAERERMRDALAELSVCPHVGEARCPVIGPPVSCGTEEP